MLLNENTILKIKYAAETCNNKFGNGGLSLYVIDNMQYDIGIEYAIVVCKQLRSLGFYAIHTNIEDLETGNKQAGILINN